jgi:FkbM family methyltransferase
VKKILLAVPTNRYIEPDTFKSIYNLDVPEGFDVTFQYFYGYQIDQIRNLIANWAYNFDYLFCVDSDMVLPQDALVKMLSHNVDIVSGVYIQRKQGVDIPEIYRKNISGGTSNVKMTDIMPQGLHEIDGCGFGCVLINCNVIRAMEYPHFVYQMANATQIHVSEDNYFCRKAQQVGAKIYVDSSIICEHIGSWKFVPTIPQTFKHPKIVEISQRDLLPMAHKTYLTNMCNEQKITPKVIYDIGACVLHWTNSAKQIWNDATYIVFEAMDETKFLYEEAGLQHFNGVLSDLDGKEVQFYQNLEWFGGNSYYRENPSLNPFAQQIFNDSHIVKKVTTTLDTLVQHHGLPLPDLIKIDVQGAELDVLRGAEKTLHHCKDIIIELQHSEYNIGAPHCSAAIEYLKDKGFRLVNDTYFDHTEVDGDYHFTRE